MSDIGAYQTQPFVVSNTNDDGPGSLRQALRFDDNSEPIVFAPDLTGKAIDLTSGPIVITSGQDTTLAWNGPGLLTISAAGQGFRVFTIDYGGTVTLSGLNIVGGQAAQGGGIYNRTKLIIANSAISGNRAIGDATSGSGEGGGIYNIGDLTITNTLFSNDVATDSGNAGSTASPRNAYGGAIYNAQYYRLTVTDSTFTGDSAIGGADLLRHHCAPDRPAPTGSAGRSTTRPGPTSSRRATPSPTTRPRGATAASGPTDTPSSATGPAIRPTPR